MDIHLYVTKTRYVALQLAVTSAQRQRESAFLLQRMLVLIRFSAAAIQSTFAHKLHTPLKMSFRCSSIFDATGPQIDRIRQMTRNDGYYAVRGQFKVTNFGTALGVTSPFVLNPRDLYYRVPTV